MENKEKKYEIILAALLHDIGKFWQRSDEKLDYRKSELISEETKKMVKDICPNYRTGYSHKHSIWTYEFLQKNKNYLPKFEQGYDNLVNLASFHHNPHSVMQTIIQFADWCSSGMDRTESIDYADDSDLMESKNRFKSMKLVPLFEYLNMEDATDGTSLLKRHAFDLNPLEIKTKNSIFPKKNEEFNLLINDYADLWKKFEDEFKKIKSKSVNNYINTLLSIMKKYLWCIPSTTMDRPDISLYDHLKTTAAIAGCLYETLDENITIDSVKNRTDKKMILLNGDISGIQSFIYSLTSKAAGKALKGRSFYVQMLSDVLAKFIVNYFDYPECNIIYTGGGGFYLLLPTTAIGEIEKLKLSVNDFLYEKFGLDLQLNMAYVTLSGSDFLEKSIGNKWKKVKDEIEIAKKKKYVNKVQDITFFNAKNVEKYNYKEEGLSEKEIEIIEESFGEYVPKDYIEYVRLGKHLAVSDYILYGVFNEMPKDLTDKVYSIKLKVSGKDYFLVYALIDKLEKFTSLIGIQNAKLLQIEKINDTDMNQLFRIDHSNCSLGFKFYGGNKYPKSKDGYTIKTLEDLADDFYDEGNNDENYKGVNKLGVLRMDVDNLGETFIKGFWIKNGNDFDKSTASISRLSNLSFLLDTFFSGYLNTILDQDEFRNKAYIVYSGGDDLFIVGNWSIIPVLAKKIYSDFIDFACKNKKMKLSGGIYLTSAHEPIFRAALKAGELESKAKNYTVRQNELKEKDSLYFISSPLRLRDLDISKGSDFELVNRIKEAIVYVCNQAENNGFLNKLRNTYLEYLTNKQMVDEYALANKVTEQQRHELLKFNKWKWRAAYNFARQKKTILSKTALENKVEVESKIDFIVSLIYNDEIDNKKYDRSIIDFIDSAIRWAEYELKLNKRR